MILCKLGDFIFKAKEIETQEVSHNFNYATINRIDNYPLYQELNKDNEVITLKGYYIREKIDKLEKLINSAKKKEPIRFTTIKESFNVVIISIKRAKKMFIKDVHAKEEFTITLKRYYEWKSMLQKEEKD